MLDITGPLLIGVLIGICSYLPIRFYLAGSNTGSQLVTAAEIKDIDYAVSAAADPIPEQYCLSRFRTEIEAEIGPCPTDSILRRHHEALVASKLESRFAELTT